MRIYILLPFTSVIDRPKSMEYSAQLTEDYMEQFGSARFIYTIKGFERKLAHCTGTRSWSYTGIRPETLKLYREEEDR